jgi:DNA-binding MarR family transcriptional regulator
MKKAAPFALHDSVGYLVNRVASAMKTALERELEPFEVTAPQWAVVATLAERRSVTVLGLADTIGVDAGAASRLVDRLEDKGIVSRRRHESDRRLAVVRLTSAGEDLYPRLRRKAEVVLDAFLRPCSRREVNELKAGLRKLLEQRPR